jgi:hypothetical protein
MIYVFCHLSQGFTETDIFPHPPGTRPSTGADVRMVITETSGQELETTVTRPGRSVVVRPVKREVIPMRFKNSAPEKFISNFEKQQYYMDLSDSDDDDKPNRTLPNKGPAKGL